MQDEFKHKDDHDILIVLVSEVRQLRADWKEYKDNNTARMLRLELEKFDSKDFSDRWGRQINANTDDLEALNNWKSKVMGALIVINILFTLVFGYIINKIP